jgi:hypothetical protein
LIDIIVSDEYLHFKFSLCGWGDDCRSAELLVDHSPQFAAGEEAGKRLPALSDAADSLVILARFRRRNRGGCIYVVQKNPLPISAGVIDCLWDCPSHSHNGAYAHTSVSIMSQQRLRFPLDRVFPQHRYRRVKLQRMGRMAWRAHR